MRMTKEAREVIQDELIDAILTAKFNLGCEVTAQILANSLAAIFATKTPPHLCSKGNTVSIETRVAEIRVIPK